MSIYFGIADMQFGGVSVGHLQGVTMDFNFETASLYSGNAIFPRDVRVHSGEISGNAEFAEINATIFEKLLGGTRTTDTIAITDQSKSVTFQMICTLVTDSNTLQVTFNKVRSSKLSMAFARDSHLIPNFDFYCEADDDGNVATIDLGDVS